MAQEKTNEGRWLINPSCIFIKLITADYKLSYNMKFSVICNKASKVSLASLCFENSTIGADFTSAFMYDLRGLMLAKSGICPAVHFLLSVCSSCFLNVTIPIKVFLLKYCL